MRRMIGKEDDKFWSDKEVIDVLPSQVIYDGLRLDFF